MAAKKMKVFKDPEWQRYAGALIEDIRNQNEAILEYVKDVPDMKEDLGALKAKVGNLEEKVESLGAKVDVVLSWEASIELIPVMFEEIGKLRHEVEILKEATKLAGKGEKRIEYLEHRVNQLEKELKAVRTAQK